MYETCVHHRDLNTIPNEWGPVSICGSSNYGGWSFDLNVLVMLSYGRWASYQKHCYLLLNNVGGQ